MRLGVLVLSVFCAGVAGVMGSEGVWLTATDGVTQVWNNYPRPGDMVRWEGGRDAEKRAHGPGTVHWFKAMRLMTSYEGMMDHGRLEGFVESRDPDGATGRGYYIAGKKSGLWLSAVGGKRRIEAFRDGKGVEAKQLADASPHWARSSQGGGLFRIDRVPWAEGLERVSRGIADESQKREGGPSPDPRQSGVTFRWTGPADEIGYAHGKGVLECVQRGRVLWKKSGVMHRGMFHEGQRDEATQRAGVSTPEPMVGKSRIALIVGNADYAALPDLRNPASDATLIDERLRGLGFGTVCATNVGRDALLRKVEEFAASAKEAEVALFYFAGHGVEVGGENYLLAADSDPASEYQLRYKAVPLGLVLSEMDAMNAGVKLIILDACRENPFRDRFGTSTRGVGRGGGLAPVAAPRGALVAFSADAGQVALDGEGENGLYTSVLARHLATPGLRIEDVFNTTRTEVYESSGGRQLPAEYSKLVGTFYPGGASATGAPLELISMRIADTATTWFDYTDDIPAIISDIVETKSRVARSRLFVEENIDIGSHEYRNDEGLPLGLEFLREARRCFRCIEKDKFEESREREPLILDCVFRNKGGKEVQLAEAKLEVVMFELAHRNSWGDAVQRDPKKHLQVGATVTLGWPVPWSVFEIRKVVECGAISSNVLVPPLEIPAQGLGRCLVKLRVPNMPHSGTHHSLIRLYFPVAGGTVTSDNIYLSMFDYVGEMAVREMVEYLRQQPGRWGD